MQKKNMAWISAAVLIVAGGTILLVGRQHHTVAAPLKVTPPTSSATVVSPSSVAPPSTTSVSNVVSSSHVAPKTSAVHTSTPAATTGGQASHSATVTPTTQPKTPQNTAPQSTAPHSTAPQSTQPQPSKTPAPAQTYPSLAKSVADKPTASLATIEANINNPQVLGELNWSSADAVAVQKALGSKTASSNATGRYALTFLYASLANNTSVFNSLISDQQGNTQFLPWLPNIRFAPDNVSQIDAVATTAIQNTLTALGQITYEYSVTYTTTGGQVLTQKFNTTLDPDHLNPAYLNLNAAGWMGNQ